jgi:hypothetical protein
LQLNRTPRSGPHRASLALKCKKIQKVALLDLLT